MIFIKKLNKNLLKIDINSLIQDWDNKKERYFGNFIKLYFFKILEKNKYYRLVKYILENKYINIY